MRARAVATAFAVLLLVAACGADGPLTGDAGTVAVHASAMTYQSLAEMAAASDVVVVGTVAEVTEGTFQPAPATEDFLGTQSLRAVIDVERVLQGKLSPGDQVFVPWMGYEVAADGTPGPQMIVDGQPPPAPGHRDVWFLAAGPDSMGLVAYEGRLRVADDGSLARRAPVGSGAEAEVLALPDVEALDAALAALGG